MMLIPLLSRSLKTRSARFLLWAAASGMLWVAFLPSPASADGTCTSRPLTQAERNTMEKARSAVQSFLPAESKDWGVSEEYIQEIPDTVCREFDGYPLQFHASRTYIRSGQEQREEAARQSMVQTGNDMTQTQKKNAARLEQIDSELEKLRLQMEAAAQRQDVAAVQQLGTKMQALLDEKNRLMGGDAMADIEKSAIDRNRDTRLFIEVVINPVSYDLVHPARPLKVAGADRAEIMVLPAETPQSENAEVLVLLGAWNQPGGGERRESVFRKTTPRTAVQSIGVRILADQKRALSVAQQLHLAGLRALLSP